MIKMIATDIDGTILPYGGEFRPAVLDCINELTKKGIKIVLVTGRMHSSAQSNLKPQIAKEIIEWARKNNVHLNLYLDDKLYVEEDNEIIQYYIKGKFVDYTVCSFDDLEIKDVNKLLAIDIHNPERVTSWVNILKEKYPQLYIVKSTPYFCEIGPSDAKKSLSVEFLRNYWDIKKEEVLTIGDQNNDIDLVECGGIGIAMGNGTEELKSCADYITDTCDNDGFVKAVEKFCQL